MEMNPETTLTTTDIQAICSYHNIPYKTDTRITTGFNNEVHLINGDTILKVCTRPENIIQFTNEKKMLEYEGDFLKPHLIAADFSKSIIPREYILMGYVEGESLGFIWHTLDDQVRESLIKEIVTSLKSINRIPPSYLRRSYEPWGENLINRFDTNARREVRKRVLTQRHFDDIAGILETYQANLDSSERKVVYWDIHFDNFIVKNGRLAALIDFESVSLCALDYPMYVIRKQMSQPEKYLTEENEQYATLEDYRQLETWYRKYYPEMFAFEHFEQRVMIYQMFDVLQLLKNWHKQAPELYDELNGFIQKLKKLN